MTMLMWRQLAPGSWGYVDGDYMATVHNGTEHWIATTYHFGEIIDKGEWDGRKAAMQHIKNAINYSKWLRDPNAHCPSCIEGDEE